MAEISLAEKTRLAESASQMIRLYALDAVWTEAAERPDGVPAESLPALRELVEVINNALVNALGHAQTLEDTFARHEKEIEAGYERLITNEQLAPEHKHH